MNAEQIIAFLTATRKRVENTDRSVSADTLRKQKGLLVSTLDGWIGEDKRRWLYAAVFGKQSTRELTPAEVATLLDWCGLDRDDISGKYVQSDKSNETRGQIETVLAWYQVEHGQMAMAL